MWTALRGRRCSYLGPDGQVESKAQALSGRATGSNFPAARPLVARRLWPLRAILVGIVQTLQPPERDCRDQAGLRDAHPEPATAHAVAPPGQDDDALRAGDLSASVTHVHFMAGRAKRGCEGGPEGSDYELVHDPLHS